MEWLRAGGRRVKKKKRVLGTRKETSAGGLMGTLQRTRGGFCAACDGAKRNTAEIKQHTYGLGGEDSFY